MGYVCSIIISLSEVDVAAAVSFLIQQWLWHVFIHFKGLWLQDVIISYGS